MNNHLENVPHTLDMVGVTGSIPVPPTIFSHRNKYLAILQNGLATFVQALCIQTFLLISHFAVSHGIRVIWASTGQWKSACDLGSNGLANP